MLDNPAFKIAANKLTNSSLVSGSLIVVGGILIWRLWSNQEQIQAKIKQLNSELQDVKKQVSDKDDKSKSSFTSSIKKFFY